MISGRFGPVLLSLALLLCANAPASADITSLGGSFPERPGNWNAVAFDPVNQVYLVAVAAEPVAAKFVTKDGVAATGAFTIAAANEGFSGWTSMTFGSSSDPAFLVIYTLNYAGGSCTHSRYGRIVRYNGGSPTVSGRIYITNVGCQWNFSERGGAVWTGAGWVVGTQVDGAGYGMPFATAEAKLVMPDGSVPYSLGLGNPANPDYFGAPSIACKTDGSVCMAMGFAGGVPFGGGGIASYGRVFDGRSLAPITGAFYVDAIHYPGNQGGNEQNHRVVYSSKIDQFVGIWWRAGYIATRSVSLTGALGTQHENVMSCPACGASGAFAGDVNAAYNLATQTILIATKQFPADLYAFEIDENGSQLGGPLLISTWDGRWPEYDPSIAADPVNGRWLAIAVETTGRALLVTGRQRRVTSDIDGDQKADLLVWRGSTGTFTAMGSRTSFASTAFSDTQFGNASLNDVPLNGDLDGDGVPDLVIWRPGDGTWYWLTSSSSYSYAAQRTLQFGNRTLGDQPLLADVDGDGKDDLIIWRASSGTFYWLTSSGGYSYATGGSVQWGNSSLGDKPLMGDLDGDRKADFAVWRASTGTFFWLLSSHGYGYGSAGGMQWGNNGFGDKPFLADVDGDGTSDLVVWRPGNGTWYWLTSSSSYSYARASSVQWGNNGLGDKPFLADFDGDGKADLAVWRSTAGVFYWLTSSSGYSWTGARTAAFGVLGDIVLTR